MDRSSRQSHKETQAEREERDIKAQSTYLGEGHKRWRTDRLICFRAALITSVGCDLSNKMKRIYQLYATTLILINMVDGLITNCRTAGSNPYPYIYKPNLQIV